MKEQMSGLPEKRCENEVSLLPYDLIFKILLLLPAKELIRLSFVCKTWLRMINSPNFVETHTNLCETVLTFLKPIAGKRPNSFSIEVKQGQFSLFDQIPHRKSNSYIHFIEFHEKNGKISDPNICGFNDILATCDGLVLAINKTGGLLVMNPITRKLSALKLGTIVPRNDESYGLVFDRWERKYNVIHVYKDRLGYIDSEILNLTTMSWHGGDAPSSGLFRDFTHRPVSISEILYWLPGTHGVSYLVSMDINCEKFVTKDLPVNATGMNDRLLDIGGVLTFVGQMTVYRIQLWNLKSHGEPWFKRYTINMDYDITGFLPIFATKNGKCLVFEHYRDAYYAYDIEEEEMEKVEFGEDVISYDKSSFPHMNTLASWENFGMLW